MTQCPIPCKEQSSNTISSLLAYITVKGNIKWTIDSSISEKLQVPITTALHTVHFTPSPSLGFYVLLPHITHVSIVLIQQSSDLAINLQASKLSYKVYKFTFSIFSLHINQSLKTCQEQNYGKNISLLKLPSKMRMQSLVYHTCTFSLKCLYQ